MSDLSKPCLDQVAALVHATWLDCASSMQPTESQSINWRDLVAGGIVALPLAIIVPGNELPFELGLGAKAYRFHLDVYYLRTIALTSAEAILADRVEDFVQPKLGLLRDALLQYDINNQATTTFILLEDPILDISINNPVNHYLRESAIQKYFAGMISFDCLISEPYV